MKTTIVFPNGFWLSWALSNILKFNIIGKMPISTRDMLKNKNDWTDGMDKVINQTIFL